MTLVSLLVVAGVTALIVFLLTRKGKKVEVEEYVMTPEDKERIINEYSDRQAPIEFNEAITGEIKDFKVLCINAYGVRYNSIENALEVSKQIPNELRSKMQMFSDALKELREERENVRRFYRLERTAFDGDVYIYNECKIKIDTPSRLNAGHPARIGLAIEKNDDDTLVIGSVYVAKDDVSNASNRTVFNIDIDEEYEAFNMLITANKMYAEEVAEINKLIERIEKYNTLVEQGRISISEDGTVTITPPTPEQIRARREELLKGTKPSVIKQEAKQQVDDEFVSSTTAI